jgi:hypothetical protein
LGRYLRSNFEINSNTKLNNSTGSLKYFYIQHLSLFQDELYKAVHKEKTIAHFTTIECKIENNKIITVPSLCEGNAFRIEEWISPQIVSTN